MREREAERDVGRAALIALVQFAERDERTASTKRQWKSAITRLERARLDLARHDAATPEADRG